MGITLTLNPTCRGELHRCFLKRDCFALRAQATALCGAQILTYQNVRSGFALLAPCISLTAAGFLRGLKKEKNKWDPCLRRDDEKGCRDDGRFLRDDGRFLRDDGKENRK